MYKGTAKRIAVMIRRRLFSLLKYPKFPLDTLEDVFALLCFLFLFFCMFFLLLLLVLSLDIFSGKNLNKMTKLRRPFLKIHLTN